MKVVMRGKNFDGEVLCIMGNFNSNHKYLCFWPTPFTCEKGEDRQGKNI